MADGLAKLQVRCASAPIVFCEARQLAEEWTYRYLAAAHAWASTEAALADRLGDSIERGDITGPPATPQPSTSEVRAWARVAGIAVPDRGRLRPEIWRAWHDVNSHDDGP